MALALAGYEVTATDKTIVLPLLQHNLSAFEAQCSAAGSVPITHSAAFDWSGERPGNLEHVAFDTVVCCDCLYATTAVEPLLNALRHVSLDFCRKHLLFVVPDLTLEVIFPFTGYITRYPGYHLQRTTFSLRRIPHSASEGV